MTNIKNITIIWLLILLLASCSHTTPSPGAPSSYRVRTTYVKEDNGYIDTISFAYDAQERIISAHPKTRDAYDVTLTYNGNQVEIRQGKGISLKVYQGILNTDGLLASITATDYSAVYTYDAAKFLIGVEVQERGTGGYVKQSHVTLQWQDSCLRRVYLDTTCCTAFTYFDLPEHRDNEISYFQPYATNSNNFCLEVSQLVPVYAFGMGKILGNHSSKLVRTCTFDISNFTSFTYGLDPYGRVVTQTENTGYYKDKFNYSYY